MRKYITVLGTAALGLILGCSHPSLAKVTDSHSQRLHYMQDLCRRQDTDGSYKFAGGYIQCFLDKFVMTVYQGDTTSIYSFDINSGSLKTLHYFKPEMEMEVSPWSVKNIYQTINMPIHPGDWNIINKAADCFLESIHCNTQ